MKENEDRGGRKDKDTIICVTVDSKKINENNIDQHVIFSDDRDEDPPQQPGNPKDYVSTISKGMKVYWRAALKDPDSGDDIEITEVISKEGKEKWKLLDSVKPEQGNKKAWVGKVKGKNISDMEAYSVKFRINGGSGKEYIVDPKLQMR